jgi:hypothetical protein
MNNKILVRQTQKTKNATEYDRAENERNFGQSVRHICNNFPLANRSRPNGIFNIDRAIGFDAAAGATILTMALGQQKMNTNININRRQ